MYISETIIISFLVFILFFVIYAIDISKTKNMYGKLKWIADKETDIPEYLSGIFSDYHILSYLVALADKTNIPQKYRFDFEDTEILKYAHKILESYKKSTARFFNWDFLSEQKKFIYELDEKEFFYYSLFLYLVFHRNDFELSDDTGTRKIRIFNTLDNYSLTDFGITYYKLFLIVALFCESCEKTRGVIVHRYDQIFNALAQSEVK